jgi:hypothetical protein
MEPTTAATGEIIVGSTAIPINLSVGSTAPHEEWAYLLALVCRLVTKKMDLCHMTAKMYRVQYSVLTKPIFWICV